MSIKSTINKLCAFIAVLIACAWSAAPAGAEYQDIRSFLKESGSILQWDPFRARGNIWYNSDVVTISTHSGFAVVNYSDYLSVDRAVVNADGNLLLTKKTIDTIKDYFQSATNPRDTTIKAIFIDPGHGGKDPGAVGSMQKNGTKVDVYEKDLVLTVGLELERLLNKHYPHIETRLSRREDVFVSLAERTRKANAISVTEDETILFISVHANASLNPQANGYEVWYLPPDFRRDNLVDAQTVGVSDKDVLSILNTIKEEEFTVESIILARNIISGMSHTVGLQFKNRGIKQESWYVVRQARMPSVLVEIGFVSNKHDVAKLTNDSIIKSLTEGIYHGIDTFIQDFER